MRRRRRRSGPSPSSMTSSASFAARRSRGWLASSSCDAIDASPATTEESRMFKSGIDQDGLIKLFSQASTKQGEALRKAVSEATLKALQGRELTLQNIRGVLKTVTQAASTGASQNAAHSIDAEALLSNAFSGMDAALLQAVEANRKALQQFVDQGVGLNEERMQSALADLEKMEDVFIATVSKAAQSATAPLQGAWGQVIESMKLKGTD